jgi:hypothetical protein
MYPKKSNSFNEQKKKIFLLVHNHLLLFLVLHVFETTSYVLYENAMIDVLMLLQLNIAPEFPKKPNFQFIFILVLLPPYNKIQKIMYQVQVDNKIPVYRYPLVEFEDNMKQFVID